METLERTLSGVSDREDVFVVQSNKNDAAWTAELLLAVFALMYVVNAWMPMYRDDYLAAVVWNTGDQLQSWRDVFVSLERYYFMHGGRLVSFFIQFAFLLYGKFWFNLFNAAIFVAMLVVVYFHAIRAVRLPREPRIFAALAVFFWLAVPEFGEVIVWMCGSAVYLWTGFFAALFLLPYNLVLAGRMQSVGAWFGIPLFFFAMVAACSVENLTVTTTFLAVAVTAYCWRRGTRHAWMLAGALGSLIGTVACLAGPGNFVRYQEANETKPFLLHIGNQFAANAEMLLYMLPVFLVLVLMWRILKLAVAKEKGITVTVAEPHNNHYTLFVVILCLVVSYFNGGFLAIWLRDGLIAVLLTPLGLTDENTISHFANTMAGFEEAMIYWMSVIYVYLMTINKLRISRKTLRSLGGQVTKRMLWNRYAEVRYAGALFVIAFINNLAVIGAPNFPGRALFSSAMMILIATTAVLRIPAVYERLLVVPAGRIFRWGGAAIMTFIVAASLIILHAIWVEDAVRVAYIARQAEQQQMLIFVPPSQIPPKARVLRHINYDDYDVKMTREMISAYYGIGDVRLDPALTLDDIR